VGVPGALDRFFTVNQMRYTPDDAQVGKWRTAMQQDFPGDRLSVYNLFGIGSAEVLVEALKRAGKDITREKLIAAFDDMKDFKTEVYAAPITCSKTDHRCNKGPAWMAKDPGGPIKVLGFTAVGQ